MRKCLFVVSNTNIGGPQKSLLALFDKIDYTQYEVDLLSIQPNGKLLPYYNKNVRVLETPPLLTALTVPSGGTGKYLKVMLKKKKFGMLFSTLRSIFKHRFFKKSMNRERQKLWQKYSSQLPKIDGTYDLAFGILGMSTYVVADCVTAGKKYHWIRSDTRILHRNEEIDRAYFEKMDGFLSVSKECAEIFENMYPLSKGRVKVLYNYIPTGFYDRMECDTSKMDRDDAVRLITVCRLDPLKGIDMAIEACRILIKQGVNLRWYVLGGGKEEEKIRAMIREAGLEDRFILLGFQFNTLAFIKKADIFVHPSRTEGKSNAVDEAKYAGKPIVVTNYPTVGESITDGYNGLICGMSGEAVAKAVKRLIDDQALQKALSDNCVGKEDGPDDINRFFEEL